MKYSAYYHRYCKIQKLIFSENTGNTDEFAEKLGVSRRSLFYYLEELRDLGLQFEYCKKRKTYYPCSKKINLLDFF
jgi:biotin operon repressor